MSPSIKDCERDSRAGSENRSMSYSIGGPGQKRPRDFLKALRNDGFKDSLLNYLVESWQDDSNAQIIGEKQIYVTCKDKCYLFQVINGSVSRTEDETLRSNHEEADSRMFFHLAKISLLGEQETAKNIVLRLSDTDVAIVGLGNLHLLPENVTVWLEVGVFSKNTLRYINLTDLHNKLGTRLCRALLFLHALTGCDYTASFYRRGKVKPLKLLEKNPDLQETFASFGDEESPNEKQIEACEEFVCKLYGRQKMKDVNAARLDIFLKKFKPKDTEYPLSKIKTADSVSLPPCAKVLLEKVKRSNYVCSVWKSATNADPPSYNPENFFSSKFFRAGL